ncbi:MAG TPA: DUF892 family protein [Terriglobales bacterium]
MRFHIAHIDNLRKLYVDQVQHLHSAEAQIIEALPKLVEAAADPELKQALQTHLEQTREQLSRVRQILDETAGTPEPKKNKPIAAMIDEGNDMIDDSKNDSVRDASIIAVCQRIEHYEIAAYGTVHNFAEIIGETDQATLLDKTLDEEKNADELLTSISDFANTRADRAA